MSVVMITGDYAATAKSIATQAGIAEGDVITGADLESLDDAQLAQRLKTVTVFARIMPEQKLRIVQAFKTDGEVVAISEWTSEAAVESWGTHPEHDLIIRRGRSKYYQNYTMFACSDPSVRNFHRGDA